MARNQRPTVSASRDARPSRPTPGVPADAHIEHFELGDETLAILSWPMPTVGEEWLERVTAAEADVLRHLVAGADLAAIARARGVSVRTVRNQLASLQKKLGADGRLGILRGLFP